MPKEQTSADHEDAPVVAPLADAATTVEDAKKPEDLVPHAQTPETHRKLRALESDIKVPSDLSKVSPAKAKELAEAGLVEDADLPGKMYKRKQDGFVARIPDYTFDAYPDYLKDEWAEIKLTTSDQG